MSGQYVRLPDSKRNELIANFNNGITDPNYEVIPSKTTIGKYTIRRRKVALPVEDQPQEQTQDQPQEQPQEEDPEEANPYTDDSTYFPSFKMNKNAMFREMQMQMNRMFIEQMKLMRQQVKHTEKKRQKLKAKSKRITDMLTSIVDDAEQEELREKQPEQSVVPEIPTSEPEEPQEPKLPSSGEILQEMNAQPEKQYKNEYEQNLDVMAGDVYNTVPSRRNRLHTEMFGI